MVMRKRITDPYGASEDEYRKFRKNGPPKAAPRKPSLEERRHFVAALKAIPMGQVFERSRFFRTIVDHHASKTYELWGQTLYIYPRYLHMTDNRVRCTGVMIGRLTVDQFNRRASTILSGENQQLWYGQVIYWLQDTVYGG